MLHSSLLNWRSFRSVSREKVEIFSGVCGSRTPCVEKWSSIYILASCCLRLVLFRGFPSCVVSSHSFRAPCVCSFEFCLMFYASPVFSPCFCSRVLVFVFIVFCFFLCCVFFFVLTFFVPPCVLMSCVFLSFFFISRLFLVQSKIKCLSSKLTK